MHPILLHLGHLTFPTFGVLTACGLLAALGLSLRTARALALDPDRVWNAGLFTVLAAFLLSRLLLVTTNFPTFRAYPILLLMVPSLTPLGLALTAIATAVYLWFRQLPLRPMLDAWAAPATLLWAFLALGHFAEGSDPGLPARHHLGLPPAPGSPLRLYPVSLFAAVLALALTAVLVWHLRRSGAASSSTSAHAPGGTASLALAAVGLAQFLLTFFRQPFLYQPPFTSILDPIQWLALGMIVANTFLFLTSPRLATHAYPRTQTGT